MVERKESALSVIENPAVESNSDDDKSVVDEQPDSNDRDQAGLYLATVIALAVPSIIVLALFLPNNTRSSNDPRVESTATGLDTSVVDEIIPSEEDTSLAAEVAGSTETAEPTALPGAIAADATPTPTVDLGLLDPASIEVIVYNQSPSVDGEYTFAIRLKSLSTPAEIDTDRFTIVVEDADGVPTATSTLFSHETLPIGSSALAAVRAADIGSKTNYVTVTLGDLEIARVPVEFS